MNPPSEGIQSVKNPLRHPYPLVRSGGLFLVLIGAGIIFNTVLNGAFIAGTMLAVLSLLFAKVLAFGKPTLIQITALTLAIILEVVLLIVMVNKLPADAPIQVRLMWVLMIVGVHFLPMAICFVPRFAVLCILCIVNRFAGLVCNNASCDLFLLADSALKVGFGLWLLKKLHPAT